MRFSEVLWEVVGSDGFVDGLMVRSWRLSCWVLAMWFYLSLQIWADAVRINVETELGVCSKITITAVNRFPFLRLRVESCILIQYIYYHPYETIVIVSAASLGQRSRRQLLMSVKRLRKLLFRSNINPCCRWLRELAIPQVLTSIQISRASL